MKVLHEACSMRTNLAATPEFLLLMMVQYPLDILYRLRPPNHDHTYTGAGGWKSKNPRANPWHSPRNLFRIRVPSRRASPHAYNANL